MKYHESFLDAQIIMQKAMKQLDDFELPCNPVNYAVAYQYAVGQNFHLMKAVDDAVAAEEVDPYLFEQMYEQYIHPKEKSEETSFNRLNDSIKKLHATGENSATSVKKLDSKLKQAEKTQENKLHINEIRAITNHIVASQDSLLREIKQAKQHSEAIQNELLIAKLEAITDPLTGLQNRQGLAQYFDKVKGKIGEHALFAAIIDIDFFKKVNDKYGHLAGDLILKRLGKLFREELPKPAKAFRYGGEEFLVIAIADSLQEVVDRANEVREDVAKLRFKSAKTKERLPQLTVSIGISQWRSPEELSELFGRADQALYQAKNSGRNQVQTL